jgi:hypothetical protein
MTKKPGVVRDHAGLDQSITTTPRRLHMRGYLILPLDVNWVDYEAEWDALLGSNGQKTFRIPTPFEHEPEWEALLGPGFEAQALAEMERMAMEELEQQELAELGIETKGDDL